MFFYMIKNEIRNLFGIYLNFCKVLTCTLSFVFLKIFIHFFSLMEKNVFKVLNVQ